MMTNIQRVHLMGIGGAGMSALAKLLKAHGLEVTGCDKCKPHYEINDENNKCKPCEEQPDISYGCVVCNDKLNDYSNNQC